MIDGIDTDSRTAHSPQQALDLNHKLVLDLSLALLTTSIVGSSEFRPNLAPTDRTKGVEFKAYPHAISSTKSLKLKGQPRRSANLLKASSGCYPTTSW